MRSSGRVCGDGQWTFAKHLTDINGKPKVASLVYATDTKIRRHTKLRSEVNPFDPEWEQYLEGLRDKRMQDSLEYRKRSLALWREQRGQCGLCRHPVTRETGWHNHHIVYKTHGGRDTLANLLMLHPTCHNQVHHQVISVSKLVFDKET